MSDKLKINPDETYEIEYILASYDLPLYEGNIELVRKAFKDNKNDFRIPFPTLKAKREFIDKIMKSIPVE